MFDLNKYKTKNNFFLLIILLLFSIFWFYLFFNFSTMWGQDSFWYTRLTENLVNGKGYTLEGHYPHAQYPPGLSLLIIPFYILFNNSAVGGLILVFILSLASIILTYFIGREINEIIGIISAFILAFHNLFIFHSVSVLTEIPFMFFSVFGLWLFMKSYEKRILIIPSIVCITFSILIRYDGFFLIFPMLFYVFKRRKDFDEFFFSKKTFIAIGLGILILGSWFLRNLIAFGKPLVNAHSSGDGSLGLSFSTILKFGSFFFETGYIFPFLVLIGFFFAFFKIKNNLQLKTFLVWILVYFLLHSWWWARGLRFYCEILILLCLFCAIGLKELSSFLFEKKREYKKFFICFFVFILVLEQFIIFNFNPSNVEISKDLLNQYDPIKQACKYSNENLPIDGIYVVPEYVVYTSFLDRKQIFDYNTGLNYLFQTNKTIYFFTDNIHSWITDPFIPKDNLIKLNVRTDKGNTILVNLKTEQIKNFEKKRKDITINSTIWKIEGFQIID